MEVGFSVDDTYDMCVSKGVSALDLDFDRSNSYPCLFRVNGSRIIDQPVLSDDGIERRWTISSYLRTVFVSSSHHKLGLALLEVSLLTCTVYIECHILAA